MIANLLSMMSLDIYQLILIKTPLSTLENKELYVWNVSIVEDTYRGNTIDLSNISSSRTLKYKNGLCPREMLVKLSTYLDMSLSRHLSDTGVGSHFKTSLLLSYFSDQVECLMWSHCLIPATSTTFPFLGEYTSFDNICTTSNASLYSITKCSTNHLLASLLFVFS